MDALVQRLQAQAGGGVAAGAEGQTGVQHQLHPSMIPLGLLPLGDYQQPLPDLHGLVEFLPVVFPVRVRHVVDGQPQGGVVRVRLFQLRHGDTHLRDGVQRRLVPLQIEGDAADAGLLPQQLLVHIVPVLLIMLQKVLEVRLVVDDDAGDALLLQQLRHRVQPGRRGIDLQLQPFHVCSLRICDGVSAWCLRRTDPWCWGRYGCRSPGRCS